VNYEDQGGSPISAIVAKNNILFSKTPTQNVFTNRNSVASPNNLPNFWSVMDSNYYARPIDDNLTFYTRDAANGQTVVTRSLAQWQAFTGKDAHSLKSPLAITNVNQLDFEFNATQAPVIKTLPAGVWKDVYNTTYSGTITLAAYRSAVLINTGASNIPPTANAGTDQSITWPASSVNLAGSGNDPDGTIAGYNWTKISGPGGMITNANSASTSVTGLTTGVYQFQLQVTDNSGGTGVDVVQVTVSKGTASGTLTNMSQTYSGLPVSPTMTTTPAGLSYSITLDGVAGGKINTGSYSALGAITDTNYISTPVSGTFVIGKQTVVINATSATFNYDGLTHFVTATTTPSATGITYLFDGVTASPPSVVGVHTEHITLVNSNIQATPVDVNVTIVTNGASIFISDTTKVYNGSPQNVTVTSAYSYTLTGSPQTNAGVYPNVTATINDGVHTGSYSATLTIAKESSALAWGQPASIPYGALLSSVQLNPTTSLPGHFVFNYPIGTKLPLGTTVLIGTFVPDDPSNINGGTVSVSINVFGVNPFLNFFITNNGQIFFIEQ
jgi:hypothetical protein